MVCGPSGATNLITLMPGISGFDKNKNRLLLSNCYVLVIRMSSLHTLSYLIFIRTLMKYYAQ